MKKGIIVVEKDTDVARDIAGMLSSLGYDVMATASSGEGAVRMTGDIRPDLVLMDMDIQGSMDGVEATRIIRRKFNVPVVHTLTVRDGGSLHDSVEGVSCRRLMKPFGERELYAAIEVSLHMQDIENKLHASEEFVSSVLANFPNPVLVINPDSSVQYVNPAFEALTGFSADRLKGTEAPYPWTADESPEKAYTGLEELLESRQIDSAEQTYQNAKGDLFWVEVTSTPIIIDGRVTCHLINWVDVTDRKEVEKRLAYIATHDQLTGLPNRLLFNNSLSLELAHARRNATKLAVMMLDLDNFKEVNDSLGHNMGDCLLEVVGKRLKDLLRRSDTVARMGGDEFSVLLPEIRHKGDTDEVAAKIVTEIQRPFLIKEHALVVTVSMGITFYPEHGTDMETLMKHADNAMYDAKKRGRNNFQYYDRTMSTE